MAEEEKEGKKRKKKRKEKEKLLAWKSETTIRQERVGIGRRNM